MPRQQTRPHTVCHAGTRAVLWHQVWPTVRTICFLAVCEHSHLEHRYAEGVFWEQRCR